jgi:DNA-binding NarL/FixJ family response regulator
MTTKKATILLLDRRRLHRDLVKHYLNAAAPDLVIIEAGDLSDLGDGGPARDGIALVVLLHFSRDVFHDAFTQLTALRQKFPSTPIAVISDYEDRETIRKTLQNGAKGFISSSIASVALIHSLRILIAGGEFVPSSALADATADAPDRRGALLPRHRFTPREIEVLALLRQGKPNKAIANALSMQESTVKVHVRNIMQKLNATNRMQVLVATNHLKTPDPISSEELRSFIEPVGDEVA